MPLTPDAPFPKSQGDNIRSKDWNDAINEVRRLDTAKLDLAGGRVTGSLTVDGNIGVGTAAPKYQLNFANTLGDKISLWGNGDPHYGFGIQGNLLQIHTDTAAADVAFGFGSSAGFTETARIKGNGRVGIGTNAPDRALTIQGADAAYMNARATVPGVEVLLGADAGGGIVSTMSNHDLQLRAGSNSTKVIIKANGNVGIGTADPSAARVVIDGATNWDNGLAIMGDTPAGVGLSLINRQGRKWSIFSSGAGDDVGTNGFAIYDATTGKYRIGINQAGNVGISTAAPQDALDVAGTLRVLSGTNPIRFTPSWTGFPDNATDRAEISNDTVVFKTLMIVGNKSAGVGRRVSVWDRLEVNGVLQTQKFQLGDKWMMSGVGDAHGNDDWLRLFNTALTGYYGGLAAGKLWSSTGTVSGSDLRRKRDVVELSDAAGGVLALRGVRFKWSDAAEAEQGAERIGLIAQEVEEVFPELVETGPDGMKGINYSGLIAPLIETVKQQHREIAELRAELRSIKGRTPA